MDLVEALAHLHRAREVVLAGTDQANVVRQLAARALPGHVQLVPDVLLVEKDMLSGQLHRVPGR